MIVPNSSNFRFERSNVPSCIESVWRQNWIQVLRRYTPYPFFRELPRLLIL
jgi:hypothetical protein